MSIDFSFLKGLNNISVATAFFPLVISFINRKYIDKILFPLFLLFIIAAIIEIQNKIYANSNLTNFPVLHAFTVIEFTLINLFYTRFFKKYFNPLIFIVNFFLFFLLAFIDYQVNGVGSFNNLSITIESVILTFYTLFLFYFTLKKLLFKDLLASPVFWINTGILIYFSGNLMLFVFSKYLITYVPTEHFILWSTIHSLINILYNVLLGIGFWKTRVK